MHIYPKEGRNVGENLEIKVVESPDAPLLGLELEWEKYQVNHAKVPAFVEMFATKDDFSLRNGVEYVSKYPPHTWSTYQPVVEAALNTRILRRGRHPDAGIRASTHIHVNVTDLTWTELQKFVFLMCVVEDTLLGFIPQIHRRRENHFAVPCCRLPLLNTLGSFLCADTTEAFHISDGGKYQTISLFRLQSLGTVEWRPFGELNSKEGLENFGKAVNLITHAWQLARGCKSFNVKDEVNNSSEVAPNLGCNLADCMPMLRCIDDWVFSYKRIERKPALRRNPFGDLPPLPEIHAEHYRDDEEI